MELTKRTMGRLTSAFLIAGGVAALIGGATHGDLPEGSGEQAFQFLEHHRAYALVHFVSIFGGVLWAIGLTSSHSLRSSPYARWLAKAGGYAALIGAAVLAVQFSLDGVGLAALTRIWSEPGADRAMLELVALLLPELMIGIALTWVMLLYGLAPLMAGFALLSDRSLILGWFGVILGTFSFFGGLSLALGNMLLPDWLVFAGATIVGSLWAIALGIHDLRLSAKAT